MGGLVRFPGREETSKGTEAQGGVGARSYEPQEAGVGGAVRIERPRWGHGGARPTTVTSNTMLRNLDFILQAGGRGVPCRLVGKGQALAVQLKLCLGSQNQLKE